MKAALGALAALSLAGFSAPPAASTRGGRSTLPKFDWPARMVLDEAVRTMLRMWVNDRAQDIARDRMDAANNDFVSAFMAFGASEAQVANELKASDDATMQDPVLVISKEWRGGADIMNNFENSGALSDFLRGVTTIKFGPGAIGRIGTVALIALSAMTLISFTFGMINIWAGLAAFGVMALFAFTFLIVAFIFAWRHPELSAMDGAQVSKVMLQRGAIRPLEGLDQPPPIAGEVIQNPLIEAHKEDER